MNRVLPSLMMLLAGCPRAVPEHLRIEPLPLEQGGPAPAAAVTDRASAVAKVVGSDPLVRSPTLPTLEEMEGVDGVAPLRSYVEQVRMLEGGDGQVPRAMQQVEDSHRGSEAVALARGYRLRVTENLLANQAVTGPTRDGQILGLITPLTVSADGATLNRAPLDWLAEDAPTESAVRSYAERWVLTGWLESPEAVIAPAGAALGAAMYDGLVETPIGALVASRAKGDDGDATAGIEALRQATRLALQEAAADRDSEQAAWAKVKKEASVDHGDDPIQQLLTQAVTELRPMGGNEAAVGGALLGLSALRWRGTCPQAPCVGVDRVDAMAVARRWDPAIDRLGHLWQVIALKDALDTMDVAHDSVMYPTGAVALVDALLGTGAGPLEDSVLRKRSPDAGVWLTLARGVGEEGVTDWQGARAALGAHLKVEADSAIQETDDPQLASFLKKISERAIP